jgi:hypothetical protein
VKLLFVSPRFLLPADEGGKIRTGQILRGMKGGDFEITLVSPESDGAADKHRAELEQLCDRFVGWPQRERSSLHRFTRLLGLFSGLPIPVRDDRDARAAAVIGKLLDEKPDVVVFDFLHSVVLAPAQLAVPSLLFTHNVEFEIFERHAKVARGASRLVWKNQARKMRTLEKAALRRFDRVVAVSERDGEQFVQLEAEANVEVIPTGVDLDFFEWRDPATSERVVFTGALDWPANEDGIHWLLREVWPRGRGRLDRRPSSSSSAATPAATAASARLQHALLASPAGSRTCASTWRARRVVRHPAARRRRHAHQGLRSLRGRPGARLDQHRRRGAERSKRDCTYRRRRRRRREFALAS